MSLGNFLVKNRLTRPIIASGGRLRSHGMVEPIRTYLPKGGKIIDVGAGTCDVVSILRHDGYDVTALDVQDLSAVDSIAPIIYYGNRMPFADTSYDVALILTVLHHTPDPVSILKEAKRISRTIIVTEDVYDTRFGKYLTYFFDSLLNAEFIGHPHTNKSDVEWLQTFANLGLNVRVSTERRAALVFRQKTYVLDRV